MNWFKILKNIQISSQKTVSRDYVKPDEPEEDCLAWFTKLYQLMQGDEPTEKELYVQDFKEYTNEKLWCPLKKGIKFTRQTNWMQPGVQKLRFTSTVVLSGERVEFECYVDVPEPSSRFGSDVDYTMIFTLYSTSGRIESEFFQSATTEKRYAYYSMYDQNRKLQLEKYKKTAEKVLKYIKGAL